MSTPATDLPRVPLAFLPTPIHRLERVSKDLGLDLWIKRDDLTGLALGGNKARKIEYLLADALQKGAEVAVTCGGAHSNFIRMLGAACAYCGLKCTAAVMDLPYEPEATGHEPRVPSQEHRLRPEAGNPFLSRLFGVDLRHHPDGPWEDLYSKAENLAREYERKGAHVYRIPVGGSSPLGAYAFFQAGLEVQQAASDFDWILFASSSGSTQTGLAYAFAGSATRIVGISSDPEPKMIDDFANLGRDLADLIKAKHLLNAKDFLLNLDFTGPGYGLSSKQGDEAIRYLARSEGILLDPIYTGKAFAGLIHLAKNGYLEGKILFWHTGGVPSLFAR